MQKSGNECGKSKVIGISRHLTSLQIMIDRNNWRMWNILTVLQLENVAYCKCLDSMITNDASSTREIKCKNAMIKAAFNKKKALYQHGGFKF
jgi:hypothetical protein